MYGKSVLGVSNKGDKYGFVNETEIRISTGITLMLGLFSLFLVLFKAEFDITLYIVGSIWLDFILKVFISPQFSIFGSFVRIFLRNTEPIWVGAVQKRFAWSIGIFFSTFVMFCLFILGGYIFTSDPNIILIINSINMNIINNTLIVVPMNPAIIACTLCIIFMWSESIIGYCIGCSIYVFLVKKGWMKEYKGQNCVNGNCKI